MGAELGTLSGYLCFSNKPQDKSHRTGTMEQGPRSKSHRAGATGQEPRGRSHGTGATGQEPWDRNHEARATRQEPQGWTQAQAAHADTGTRVLGSGGFPSPPPP